MCIVECIKCVPYETKIKIFGGILGGSFRKMRVSEGKKKHKMPFIHTHTHRTTSRSFQLSSLASKYHTLNSRAGSSLKENSLLQSWQLVHDNIVPWGLKFILMLQKETSNHQNNSVWLATTTQSCQVYPCTWSNPVNWSKMYLHDLFLISQRSSTSLHHYTPSTSLL